MYENYKSKPIERSTDNNIVGLSDRIIKKIQEYDPVDTEKQAPKPYSSPTQRIVAK